MSHSEPAQENAEPGEMGPLENRQKIPIRTRITKTPIAPEAHGGYAKILQQRLANGGIEEKLWKNQYGFRRKLSTPMPLFIFRRIQDFAEHSYTKHFLVFLDWEKAFDNVVQRFLVIAMETLNIPDKIIKVLESCYVEPKVRIKDRQGYSSYRKQNAGIRQGCPLSPYLFICLLTVLFMDIHTELDHEISAKSVDICSNLWELLYADNTMLIGTRARELNMLIKAIEEESEKYNLRLNYDKCNCLAMYGKSDINSEMDPKCKKHMKWRTWAAN